MKARAFSLVELLAVLAIMALLIALVVPSAGSITRGVDMSRAGSSLLQQFQQARQLATSKARTAEIRLYAVKEGATEFYRSVQIFLLDERGEKATAASGVISLPTKIVLHSGATYSPLLTNALLNGTSTLPNNVPCTYKALRFRPSGTPEWPSTTSSFVTAVFETDFVLSRQPKNFACIKIQPVTGRPILYRP